MQPAISFRIFKDLSDNKWPVQSGIGNCGMKMCPDIYSFIENPRKRLCGGCIRLYHAGYLHLIAVFPLFLCMWCRSSPLKLYVCVAVCADSGVLDVMSLLTFPLIPITFLCTSVFVTIACKELKIYNKVSGVLHSCPLPDWIFGRA